MALLDYRKLQISIMTLIQLIHIKYFATFVIVLDTDRRFAPSLHKTYLSHYEYRVMNRNVVRQKYVFENGKNVIPTVMLIDFYLVLELCIGSQLSDSRNFDHFVTKRIFQIRPVTYVQKYDCKDDTNVDTIGNTTVDFYVILELRI